jgi:hypothetical protein
MLAILIMATSTYKTFAQAVLNSPALPKVYIKTVNSLNGTTRSAYH